MKVSRGGKKGGSRLAGPGGFTILEVLVAMTILAIILLGVAQMQASAIRYNTMGRDLTSAITWAQCTMERIMAARFAQVVAANYPPIGVGGDPNYPQFSRVVTITPGTDMANVQVTVSWAGLAARSYTIQSTISPKGFLEEPTFE